MIVGDDASGMSPSRTNTGGHMLRAVLAALIVAVPASLLAQAPAAMAPDQLPATFTLSANPHTLNAREAADGGGVLGRTSNGNVLGVDSLKNFSSYFYFPGFDSSGNLQFTWPYTMVGRTPFRGEEDHSEDGEQTTRIGAPIVAVTLDLRNADGSPRFVGGQPLISRADQFVTPVLKSPVFSDAVFDSSEKPTQFTDALQRAEFFHVASEDWHTLLTPHVRTTRTMVLKRGTYRFALNPDGTCCRFVLIDINTFVNELFPATPTDTTTPIGAAEHAGDITTRDMSTFLFNNAFLFFNNDPNNCCVIGFHSYDLEPGSAANGFREKRFVVNYSSWVSPGIFRDPTFGDVTALSHELSETFNDPFVNNATPWWLAPNGLCQNNLETGDVIEGLAKAQFPMKLNGFTYHPQNEALLEWFAGETPSSAIHHAYSYPDTTVLTSAAVSQNPGCKPPLP
jgi:hypothetical protein